MSSLPTAKRRRENWTIAAILVFQIAMPLSYYLSGRAYDERFSWRMFSTLRLRDCKIRVTEHSAGGRSRNVNIERDVHVAWLRLLERMRSAVIDAYLERRCENEGVTSVDFVCHCTDTDGAALPPMERSSSCGEVQP
ncbi:MAG TPA: hypothetical protein VFN67_20955 [Polyangiales bacterium]|nr:hypothetical protein [Polyangiales bacterium]